MTTTTFSVRVGRSTKSRLEQHAKNTGRSRSFLTAEAISVGRLAFELLRDKFLGNLSGVSEFQNFCEERGIVHKFESSP